MARALHWVGSLPDLTAVTHGRSATPDRNRMHWFLDHSQDHELTGLPCDQDPDWIIAFLRCLKEDDDVFEVAKPGDYTGYDDLRCYRVKPGVTLLPEHVSDYRVDSIRRLVELTRQIRALYPHREGLRHQVSVPNPFDLAYAIFGGALKGWGHKAVFRQAAVDEIAELCAHDAVDLTFQIEAPSVLIILNRVPRFLRRLVARRLACDMAAFVAELPRTASLVLHLCYGDLRHKAAVVARDLEPAVVYLNELGALLRSMRRDLPPVHIPAGSGDQPPSTSVAFYQPLRHLDPEWELIAGVVDEAHARASERALGLFEAGADRQALAVATACGLGRRIPGADVAAAALMGHLARYPDYRPTVEAT